MNTYLKTYHAVLHTVSPVFVGSGHDLTKKEYIFLRDKKKVLIPNIESLYMGLQQKKLASQFTSYLLMNPKDESGIGRMDLRNWLEKNHISPAEYSSWIQYELSCGDFLQTKGPVQICMCQKDSYNLPYIPGTSIKGMLRTALLSMEILRSVGAIRNIKSEVSRVAKEQSSRRNYLVREKNKMETEIFHRLNRKNEKGEVVKKENAVNDVLAGIVVSDSKPLAWEDLVLCQKVDKHVEGDSRRLNLLRECIKPERHIEFSITIDSQICSYTIEDIREAIRLFSQNYYDMFLSRFQGVDRPKENSVWLGGGTGFFTKTVLYSLLGYELGLQTAVDVFVHTLPRKIVQDHKHYKDIRWGVSPHMLKYTNYQGKRYHMGECHLQIKEV